MKHIAGILTLLMVFAACQKDNNNEDNNPAGNNFYGKYIGTFYRSGTLNTASVQIYFKDDKTFEGTSDTHRYPAICAGTFVQTGADLLVNDTCSWTADFDWTLIFDGSYSISFIDKNSLRIWRTNGTVTDEYLLKRLVR